MNETRKSYFCFDTSHNLHFNRGNHQTDGTLESWTAAAPRLMLPWTGGLFPCACLPALFQGCKEMLHFTLPSSPASQPANLWQWEAGDGAFGRHPLVWLACTCDRLDRDLCRAVSISLESCMWSVGCTLVTLGCSLC